MSRRYQVKEIFYTLQGEGAQQGRPAVFCRFSGCNLWSGREQDRADAICQFCDTAFRGTDGVNGGSYSAAALCVQILSLWPSTEIPPFVVCTGGEPLLQLDAALVCKMKEHGFQIAVETNGTLLPPPGIDWVCVSPKAHAEMRLLHGDELKLVFPQPDAPPEKYAHLDFSHFFLQPMDNAHQADNIQACITYCLSNPQWKLSLQTHKTIGLP